MRRLLVVLILVVASCSSEQETVAPPPSSPSPLASVSLSECVINQGNTAPTPPTGQPFKLISPSTLTVGSDTAFPPFESIVDGKAEGFDIDLITEIASRLQPAPKVEVQSAAFDTIFTALAAGKFDVVISAVTIKDERKQTVDFTEPYFDADQSLTVRSADVGKLDGVESLAGKIVGVQSATTGEDCAKNALKAKDKIADVRSYDTAPDAFNDLAANRIDAVLVDLPTAKQILSSREGMTLVQKIATQESYGIAVSKNNPDLRVAINKALADMKSDGTYDKIYEKWLKTKPIAK